MNNGIFIENLTDQIIDSNIVDLMQLAADTALLRLCGHNADIFISVITAEEVRRLNEETRGINSVTDVLSFPYIDYSAGQTLGSAAQADHMLNPDTGHIMLGDIIVCLPRAIEQADEYGHTLLREMAFLTTHGTLHLLGYDHETEDDTQEMFSMQESILAECGVKR